MRHRWGENVMHLRGIIAGAAVCACLVLGMGLVPAMAESGPPISVSGFTYRPNGPIHAFLCNRASCGGETSLVSYVFYPPKPVLTFQDYKNQRKKLEQELKTRFGPGVTIKFKPPTQRKEKPFSM